MEHIDSELKFHGIDRRIGVCAVIFDHFKDAGPWSSPRFRAWMFPAKLRNAESGSNLIDNSLRESQQIILARSGPEQRLLAGNPHRSCHPIIPVLGYRVKWQIPSNILVDKHFRDLLSKDTRNLE